MKLAPRMAFDEGDQRMMYIIHYNILCIIYILFPTNFKALNKTFKPPFVWLSTLLLVYTV